MKTSFWTLGTPGWSNEEIVAIAAKLGYDGVDLRCAADGNVSLDSDAGELAQLTQLFEGAGLGIASLLCYNGRGNEDGVDWRAVESDLMAHIDLARGLGVTALRVQAGRPARHTKWDVYLAELATVLRSLLKAGEGIELLVQNHPGSVTAQHCERLAELVSHERFGIGFSPDHCVDMDEDPIEAAAALAPFIRQVYLADRVRLPDGRLRPCLPGDGIAATREVLQALTARGFDGWVSFKWEKPTYPDLPDAREALPRFMGFMSSL